MRLGLCCVFNKEPIRFRTMTARSIIELCPEDALEKWRSIAEHNASALRNAIEYCAHHETGCFRVNSQILPLRTHPAFGFNGELLGEKIRTAFRDCGNLSRQTGTRVTFHPDQFVVLSSPNPAVVAASLAEVEYQAEVAEWIGADVINIHAGGGYGDKPAALRRLAKSVEKLSDRARSRLTIENDDRIYTPKDLFPVCKELNLPLVYDVHHHRCHGDSTGIETTTERALRTWNREPLFHISSPRDGWHGKHPRKHSDYIDLRDFPSIFEEIECTIEVEAKAKELAVQKLSKALKQRGARR